MKAHILVSLLTFLILIGVAQDLRISDNMHFTAPTIFFPNPPLTLNNTVSNYYITEIIIT